MKLANGSVAKDSFRKDSVANDIVHQQCPSAVDMGVWCWVLTSLDRKTPLQRPLGFGNLLEGQNGIVWLASQSIAKSTGPQALKQDHFLLTFDRVSPLVVGGRVPFPRQLLQIYNCCRFTVHCLFGPGWEWNGRE